MIDGIALRSKNGNTARLQHLDQIERRLPAKLYDDTGQRLLALHDIQDVFGREGFEIKTIGRVVVGAHRLRIAVDHDRLVARGAHRLRGVHAAVVELDALSDSIGPPPRITTLRRSSAPPRFPDSYEL